jgi:hypothetical protein
MAQSQLSDHSKPALQPPCPRCHSPMWLMRLAFVDSEHDRRTFECQVCEYTDHVIVKFRSRE